MIHSQPSVFRVIGFGIGGRNIFQGGRKNPFRFAEKPNRGSFDWSLFGTLGEEPFPFLRNSSMHEERTQYGAFDPIQKDKLLLPHGTTLLGWIPCFYEHSLISILSFRHD